MVSNFKQGAKLRAVTSHFSDMSSLECGKDLNIKKDERQSIYTGLIITIVIRNYGIIGEGSQIPTNQRRESTVSWLLIGRNLRPFPDNFVLYSDTKCKTDFEKAIFQKVLTGGRRFSCFGVGGFTVNYLTAACS